MTREQIIQKCRMFRERGLSHKAITERMRELHGLDLSSHTIRRWCDYTLARKVA